MAKTASKSKGSSLPTTFDILAMRIQKIINSPTAQKARTALIYKATEESQDDWDKLLEAMNETEGVSLIFQDDDGVQVSWEKPVED